jgi:hypothetical protein
LKFLLKKILDHKIQEEVMDHIWEWEGAWYKTNEKCCWIDIGLHLQDDMWKAHKEAPLTKMGVLRNLVNYNNKKEEHIMRLSLADLKD